MIKKRNRQDATLRNINALKKRVAALEKTSKEHSQLIGKYLFRHFCGAKSK